MLDGLIFSETGTVPRAEVSCCQEHQVLARAGTVPLARLGASRQPGTVAASSHPSSHGGCRMCLFPPLGMGWGGEKSHLGHAVSQGAWEKILKTAMQRPEARFQLPTIGFPAMLNPRAPTLPLHQQHQLGQELCVLVACGSSKCKPPSLLSPRLNRNTSPMKKG